MERHNSDPEKKIKTVNHLVALLEYVQQVMKRRQEATRSKVTKVLSKDVDYL